MVGRQVEHAVEILRKGGIVAFPTDTVYGIGTSPFIEQAVIKIYHVKQRPRYLALPLLLSDKHELKLVAETIPELAWRLAERFFPGGLTLVLKKAPTVPSVIAPGETIAVRVPNHPVPIAIIQGLGTPPLIGTSANLSGKPSPVTAQQVREQLGDGVDFIIDGSCHARIESTVVDVSGEVPRIIRQGAVPRGEIEAVCGCCLQE